MHFAIFIATTPRSVYSTTILYNYEQWIANGSNGIFTLTRPRCCLLSSDRMLSCGTGKRKYILLQSRRSLVGCTAYRHTPASDIMLLIILALEQSVNRAIEKSKRASLLWRLAHGFLSLLQQQGLSMRSRCRQHCLEGWSMLSRQSCTTFR